MASILKVDTIQDQSGNNIINESADTITIGASGDTITIPSGATIDLSSATQTGVGGTNTPAFKVYLGSNQTVSNTVDTRINLNTEIYDTDSAFDSSTNYRFTVPAGKGGKYYFGYQVWYFDANAGTSNFADMYLKINGTGDGTTNIRKYGSFTNHNLSYAGNTTLSLNAGDYVELWSYTQFTSGTNTVKAINTAFTGFKLIE
jgi:hypothetical protein